MIRVLISLLKKTGFFMKKTFLVLLLINASAFENILAQNFKTLNSILDKVNVDTTVKYLRQLSGGEEIFLDATVKISSRHRTREGNILAAQFLKKQFKQFGLATFQQDFLSDGQNIYAVQKGSKYLNQQVLICAHYDCMPSNDFAPGVDDNGSGTAAVLEAARVISKYQPEYTIVYALWDLEEQGLIGSNYYAKNASQRKDSIIAVINLDMISYDSNQDFMAEINVRDYYNSVKLSKTIYDLNQNLSIGLNLQIINPGITSSDHSSFWSNGFSAICLIESLKDFNKNYHQTTDNMTILNKEYFYRMIKLSVASLASIAFSNSLSEIEKNIPAQFLLAQNFPNPFNPSTNILYSIPADGIVQIKIFDLLGREVSNSVNEFKTQGTHLLKLDLSPNVLSSGVYYYSLKFGGTVQTRKMVLLK